MGNQLSNRSQIAQVPIGMHGLDDMHVRLKYPKLGHSGISAIWIMSSMPMPAQSNADIKNDVRKNERIMIMMIINNMVT